MAFLPKQLRISSVNGRWIDSLPKEYFCIHIRNSGRCGGSKCFVGYLGSGPHQCANPHCRGHRSACDPPCLGNPPVMRLCDIEAEKTRRERLNQQMQLQELEQDRRIGPTPWFNNFPPLFSNQANMGVGQQALAPYFFPPWATSGAPPNYAPVPRPAQQSAKSTVQHEEEDVLRRVLALSLDDSQNPPARSPSNEDDALRRVLSLSLEDTRNTSDADDAADAELLEAIRQSQIEPTPRAGDQSRELEEVIRLSQIESRTRAGDQNHELEEAIRLSQIESRTRAGDHNHELEEAIRLSQLQTGPPSDQDLLAEAIRQNQVENQRREERGNFVTLATMGQRAKQVRLERGEDIDNMATETSLRSREYRGDDDFAVAPVRASPAAETPAPAPAPTTAINVSPVSTSTPISITTSTTRHQSNAPVSTTARSQPRQVPASTATTTTTTEPPSYDEWVKSVELAMQQQENNSALGPSPSYSAVVLPGERSAEFDANDEVRTWTTGD